MNEQIRPNYEVRTLPCGCKVGRKFTNLCEVLHTSKDRPDNEMEIVKSLKRIS